MKKMIILLLIMCMVVPMFGCNRGKTPETPADTSNNYGQNSGEGDRGSAESALPKELTFDNQLINIAVRDRADTSFELDPDDNSVDILAQDIAERNNAVQDQLEVEIKMHRLPGTWANTADFITNIRNNSKMTGDDLFDIVFAANYIQVPLMLEGIYTNLIDQKYLYLDRPWWNTSFNDACSYNNKLYMTEGELTLSMIDSAFVMFFDTANFNTANEGGDDIYKVVRENQWTFAKLKEYAADFNIDANGDGNKDSGDTFGMVSPAFACGRDGFPMAFNLRVVSKSADGRINLCFHTASEIERTTNIYESFHQFLYNSDGVWVNGNNDGAREDCRSMFQNGKVVFITELLNYASILRGLERDYSIIPLPMYDEMQGGYYTSSEAVHSQISVSSATQKADAACATLELLCFYTYKNVTLDYFETVKYRNQKRPETVEMLDIVLDSITSDFGSQFASQIGNPFPACMGEDASVSGMLTGQEKRIQIMMDNFKMNILNLGKSQSSD